MAAKYIIFKETEDQDLAFENGDFQLVEDQDAVQQQLGTTLRLAKNDWFTDLDEGLRWIDNQRGILGASALSSENEAEIIQRITNTFGVVQLVQFTTQFLTKTNFNIDAQVLTEFSQTPLSVSITI